MAITGLLGCAVFIVPAALTEDAYVAVYCLTASMFFLEFTIGPSWAVPMDTGGKYSGTVSGMMNMAGNFGGAISPIVFGYLAYGGNWQAPFIVAAVPARRRGGDVGVLDRSRQGHPDKADERRHRTFAPLLTNRKWMSVTN